MYSGFIKIIQYSDTMVVTFVESLPILYCVVIACTESPFLLTASHDYS